MGHNPDKRGIRVASARSTGATDNDEIEDSEEGDKDDDIDYKSETTDLSSLQDIFARSGTGFRGRDNLSRKTLVSLAPVDRTSKGRCHEGDSANPIATTAAGVQLGASQDNPIVLDDDQSVNIHDAASPDDEKPPFKVASWSNANGPWPTLSRGFAEQDTNDGKNTPDKPSEVQYGQLRRRRRRRSPPGGSTWFRKIVNHGPCRVGRRPPSGAHGPQTGSDGSL
ncbi:uncharacterized protein Z518_10209 [Rhinocladiella mackenziei CBS 650.93]|uniref:Uncharacterized protein n=1 Tax=Rhinocladiella mackenziei CBS 650.93 TaxID=1442369 RepID=A0A0D2GS52_9EURO|nr:uncharacterized protein Z518_10209 [Rhinocladiella mackenziei CBS 650.93]KIX01143.1 hypothetical protein Z518_10209 [Rhinocladiella mackenziei CBS 650.93]